MNLLLLDQFSDPGGAQRCLLDVLPAMRHQGWNVLVAMPGEGELFARVREFGFQTARIDCGPYRSGRKSPTDAARFFAGTPRLSRQIRRLAGEIHADLIYLNGPRLLPAAALWRPDLPVVFHSHSLVPAGMTRELAGLSLRRLNASLIGACQFVADPWSGFVPPDRVSVIYNGVAGPDRAVVPRAHSATPRIGCIGRIAPEKGQLEFLAAARIILQAIPDCRFVLHGAALFAESAAHRYEAEVRAAAHGLPVEFAGWTTDVYSALSELDVLLVPSTAQEATTRVILEAYAAGVPVISFASGGIPEVVTSGHDGFLVQSVEEMAQHVVELLHRPDARLGEHARETWWKRFTLERYQREVIAALERVCAVSAC